MLSQDSSQPPNSTVRPTLPAAGNSSPTQLSPWHVPESTTSKPAGSTQLLMKRTVVTELWFWRCTFISVPKLQTCGHRTLVSPSYPSVLRVYFHPRKLFEYFVALGSAFWWSASARLPRVEGRLSRIRESTAARWFRNLALHFRRSMNRCLAIGLGFRSDSHVMSN